MSNNKNFLDEINKIAGTAFSSAVQAKDSVVEFIKQHMESLISSKDLVSREEFEALKEVVMHNQKKKEKKKSDTESVKSKKVKSK
jgi:BMFP domain-containing protein YqiC